MQVSTGANSNCSAERPLGQLFHREDAHHLFEPILLINSEAPLASLKGGTSLASLRLLHFAGPVRKPLHLITQTVAHLGFDRCNIEWRC